MALTVDVHEDVAGLIAAVAVHVVIDFLGREGGVVAVLEGECRTFGEIFVDAEVSGLGETAGLEGAVVVDLALRETIGQFLEAALDGFALGVERLDLPEVHIVVIADFLADLHGGVGGESDRVFRAERNLAGGGDAGRERGGQEEAHVALGLVGVGGDELHAVRVAVQRQEGVAVGRGAFAEGDGMVHALAAAD